MQNLQTYFKHLYRNARSKVITSTFQSDVFSFKRGVFKGDPMSPIIFLLAFNPIIHFINNQKSIGYNLPLILNSVPENIKEERIITLPYADDFCIITTDMRKHQKLIHTINEYTQSMGMRLKLSKCRSFSIRSGKPTIINFFIGEYSIPSIFHEEQKFLGKFYFSLANQRRLFIT